MDKEIENSVVKNREEVLDGEMEHKSDKHRVSYLWIILKIRKNWSELKLLWIGSQKDGLKECGYYSRGNKINEIRTESCSSVVLIDR